MEANLSVTFSLNFCNPWYKLYSIETLITLSKHHQSSSFEKVLIRFNVEKHRTVSDVDIEIVVMSSYIFFIASFNIKSKFFCTINLRKGKALFKSLQSFLNRSRIVQFLEVCFSNMPGKDEQTVANFSSGNLAQYATKCSKEEMRLPNDL